MNKKNKKLLALAMLGGFAASPMLANAGVVTIEGTSATKTSTFATDMFGPASAADTFYLPDAGWYPAVNIPANSTARFNLGGIAGVAATYAGSAINENNFVFRTPTGVAGAYTGAFTAVVGAGAVLADVTAAVQAVQTALAAGVAQPTLAQYTAGFAAATSGVVANGAYRTALGLTPATDPGFAVSGAFKTAIDVAVVATTSSYVGLAGSSITALPAAVGAGNYTNGDSTSWVTSVGAPWLGFDGTNNIFSIATSPAGSVEAVARMNIAMLGSAVGADSVQLSLDSGRYEDNANLPVSYATGANAALFRVKVSNLTPIGFNVSGASVNMTVTASHPVSGSLDQSGNTSVIARSADPLIVVADVDTSPTTPTVAADLPTTINTASSEFAFSLNGGAGSWFGNALTVPGDVFNHLGSFKSTAGTLATAVVYQTSQAATSAYLQISNSSGSRYGYTSTDTKAVTFTLNSATAGAAFAAAGSFWLSTSNNCNTVNAGDVSITAAAGDPLTGTTTLTANAAVGADVQDGVAYTLCAKTTAANAAVIDAVTATMRFSIANNKTLEPHYQDPAVNVKTLGTWTRNGCSVTFFNVPATTAVGLSDVPFLRFTNTTASTVAGTVRVSAWNQDGTQLGLRGALLTSANAPTGLIGHQTGVYQVADLSTALGLAPVAGAAPWVKRIRVVLSGGFATCEGQNIVRAKNGTLVNITATTNANQNTNNATAGIDTAGFNGNNNN